MSVNKYDATTDTLTKVAGNATVPIDDTTPSTDKVYSSSKVESVVSGLIDDTTASTTSVYSSSKVESKFSANRTNRTFSTLVDYIISLDCDFGDIQYCGSDYTDVPINKGHWGQGYFFGCKSDMITIIISANTGSIFYIGNLKVPTKEITWKQLATIDSANPLPYISTSTTNVLYYALTNIGKASDKTHLMRVTAISSSGSNVALFTYKHTTSNTKIVISSNNLTITAQNESGTIAYSSTPTRIIVEYIAQLD